MRLRFLERIAPMLVGMIAGTIALFVSPTRAPREFFNVASQIVVVLMLATALQSRLLMVRDLNLSHLGQRSTTVGPERENPSAAKRARLNRRLAWTFRVNYLVGALLPLLGGEFNALSILMDAHKRQADPRFVMLTIAWALAALATASVLSEPPQRPTEIEPPDDDPSSEVVAPRA